MRVILAENGASSTVTTGLSEPEEVQTIDSSLKESSTVARLCGLGRH